MARPPFFSPMPRYGRFALARSTTDGQTFNRERLFLGPYGSDLRELPTTPLYLHLTKSEWAQPWIGGGEIPIFSARKYLSNERAGVMTPDEIRQERWDGASRSELEGAIKIEGNAFFDIRMQGCRINGVPIPDTRIDRYDQNAAILCLSLSNSRSISKRLGKECCLEIKELSSLIEVFFRKFGNALYGKIIYTKSGERSHFMKGEEDDWMEEFRIVAPGIEENHLLTLPKGIAALKSYED